MTSAAGADLGAAGTGRAANLAAHPTAGPLGGGLPDADHAVVIEGLVKSYGTTVGAAGVSLVARRAEVTAVLGPNGAGKTTTVECCEGLRTPDSGRVAVVGLDPVRQAAQLRPRIGVMLQDGGLPNGARVAELLRHVAAMHADPLPVPALIERLGLDGHQRAVIRRLSGGQRQRVALAAALVGRPEVLFLDEPSAGLDPQARLAVWELIEEARGAGVGVVMTTHSMQEAERLADAVVVIDAGTVVATGSPAELVGPDSAVMRFIAPAGIPLHELALALPVTATVSEEAPGHYLVSGDVDPRTISTVTSWCAGQGLRTERIELGHRSLEDVFLDLTGRRLR